MDYYLTKHMPMVGARLKPSLKAMTVDNGISGRATRNRGRQPRDCDASIRFRGKRFQAAFIPHAAEIQGDIPKYTNISPTIQISEVKM